MLLRLLLRLWLLFAVISRIWAHTAQISNSIATARDSQVNLPLLFNWTIQNPHTRAHTHTNIHTYMYWIINVLHSLWYAIENVRTKKRAASQTSQEKIVIVSLSRNLNIQPIWVFVCLSVCVYVCDLLNRIWVLYRYVLCSTSVEANNTIK